VSKRTWGFWQLLVAFALLLVTAFASAASSHRQWVSAAASSLPVYFEDKAPELESAKASQLASVAAIVAEVSQSKAPRPPQEWAALLLTVGYHESTFSLRIHRGECRPRECDAGRARSAWQLHRNLYTAPVWDQLFGLEHTEAQVRAADGMLRRAYHTCSRSGVPWLQATLSAFAGKRCGADWNGLAPRVATWSRLVRVGVPAGGAS
jgi:hypothetical protein